MRSGRRAVKKRCERAQLLSTWQDGGAYRPPRRGVVTTAVRALRSALVTSRVSTVFVVCYCYLYEREADEEGGGGRGRRRERKPRV